MTIGTRLRAAREAQGLNQTDFAAQCGVSKNAQYAFEKDQNMPGSAYLVEVSKLGIDVNYVLLGMPGAMTPEESVLLNAFRAADPNKRGALLAHVLMGQSVVSAEPTTSIKAKQVVARQTISRDQKNDFSNKR